MDTPLPPALTPAEKKLFRQREIALKTLATAAREINGTAEQARRRQLRGLRGDTEYQKGREHASRAAVAVLWRLWLDLGGDPDSEKGPGRESQTPFRLPHLPH